ncbi:TetR/AcrR family transcriptional regulator [Brucepastera parasyntrophica]|uniref:TetR/AcrR family transcriptional regulator n=1 Tax=Brucepastera parasyntrophica TaxID=2880008 RepID=UPI00210DB6D1|nr:helix-turn-helix domain-containing protein [Brucepastera parasyntrophica]ULQ59541.1 TetR/AcrR family transcriptional regulator [Brucepastera parasyntrophica]
MTDERLGKILNASSRLFIKPGYAQTQVSHIVRACGISVGSLYDLFSGKKAILGFVLKCVLDPEYINSDFSFPISDDLFTGLDKEIKDFFREKNRIFARPLKSMAKNYPFRQMLTDAFDMIHQYGAGLMILENNPSVFRDLFNTYKDYRHTFFGLMRQYIDIYIERRHIRKTASPDLCVLFIVEAMTWWGIDIKYTSFEPRDDIPDELAKSFCLESLIRAYKM